jgi:hypothetical protein
MVLPQDMIKRKVALGNIKEAAIKRSHDPEWKKNNSESQRGKIFSEETLQKNE